MNQWDNIPLILMNVANIFFYGCLCFIGGVFLSSFFYFSQIALLAFFIFGIILMFLHMVRSHLAIMIFCCFLFLIFGIWRYQLAKIRLERPELERFYGQEVVLNGCVVQEPNIKTSNVKLELKNKELNTKILVATSHYPEINYGDILKVKGVLKEAPVFEGFNYKNYLKNQGIYFLMSYPDIQILGKTCGNPIKKTLISFKNKLKNSLEKTASVPLAGLFEALIFGDENNIPENWKEKLNLTGTRHIAAVSGMNITILSGILLEGLLFFGFWRNQAFWLSIVLIFFYILMIGAPASGVRAGIIGGLFLLSQYSGRIAEPERLMVFALFFMLLFNPLLLAHDIGFQLSFLAFAGLIYLGPFFSRIFKRAKITDFLGIRMILASTLSAQIFVLPILLYNFGQFSLIAPLANILVLPAIMPLTVLGFSFSFLGIFLKSLAQIFSWPAQLLMLLIIKIIDVFSQIPWASKQVHISGIFVFISYFLLAIFVWYLKKRQKLWFLNY